MFNHIQKIVVSKELKKENLMSVTAQRSQCRTTHKRKDC